MLSRRTKASSPSRVVTNVPFVLWSISRNLLRLYSMRACSREIRLPLTTMSFSSARPIAMFVRLSSTTISSLKAHAQAAHALLLAAGRGVAERDRRQHAGGVFLLPQHLEQLVLAGLALERRDVDLPHGRLPFGREPLDHRAGDHDLAGLRLAGHAVRGMHGRAEDVAVLQHHRAEVPADADRDRLPLDLQLRMDADVVLHATALSASFGGERRHDLVADRLDHRSVVLLGCSPHDLHAGQDHIAGPQVAHDLVDARAADHIGEQDGEFYVFSHDLFSLTARQDRRRLSGVGIIHTTRHNLGLPGSPRIKEFPMAIVVRCAKVPTLALCAVLAPALAAGGLERAAARHRRRVTRSGAVRNLRVRARHSLVTEVGPRSAGSSGDAAAVRWALNKLGSLGFSQVRSQDVLVPRWVRGHAEVTLAGPNAQSLVASRWAAASALPMKASRRRFSKSHRWTRSTRCPPRPSAARSFSSTSAWSARATVQATAQPCAIAPRARAPRVISARPRC